MSLIVFRKKSRGIDELAAMFKIYHGHYVEPLSSSYMCRSEIVKTESDRELAKRVQGVM